MRYRPPPGRPTLTKEILAPKPVLARCTENVKQNVYSLTCE
jgi:hypothetical protein